MLQLAHILIITLILSFLLLSQSAKDCLHCIWTLPCEGIVMFLRRLSEIGVSGNAFKINLVTFY
jgi:hypothetical protein